MKAGERLVLEPVELKDLKLGEVYLMKMRISGTYFLQIKTEYSSQLRTTKVWRLP